MPVYKLALKLGWTIAPIPSLLRDGFEPTPATLPGQEAAALLTNYTY